MSKRLLTALVIVAVALAAFAVSVFAVNTENGGIGFTGTDYYQSTEALADVPLTFETWIRVSEDMPDTAKGPIAGNYNGGVGTHDVINFEIAELGVPKVYVRKYNADTATYADAVQIYFPGTYNASTATIDDPVDLRTGELLHLAITLDPAANRAYCYVNGELVSTFSGEYYYYSSGVYKKSWKSYDISAISSMDNLSNVCIGRDHRTGSSLSYLAAANAEVRSVALYSETLTAEAVVRHADGSGDGASAIVSYDLTAGGYMRLKDHSGNGNHLYYTDTSGAKPLECYKEGGIAFGKNDYYQSTDYLTSFPYTFETWLNVDADAPDTLEGAIAGNYDAGSGDSVVFAIGKLGVPRVYLKPYDESAGTYGSAVDVYFPEVDLRQGRPVHLAITFDPSANRAYCYIDGELKSTYTGQKYYYNSSTGSYSKYSSVASISFVSGMESLRNIAVGRDHRTGSYLFALDGKYAEIYSVAAYSTLLDVEAIAADALSVSLESDALLFSYDLTGEGTERLRDCSKNENHLFYSSTESIRLTEWYDSIDSGFSLLGEDLPYRNDSAPADMPRTIEASVYFPISDKVNFAGGVIMSTLGYDKGGLCLSVGKGGTLVFTTTDRNGKTSEFTFDKACVYTDRVTHLAVAVDEAASEIRCYIDGALVQTLAFSGVLYESQHIAYAIGGDYRSGNKYAFAGGLVGCAAYSDVRTADEIMSDVSTLDGSSLMFAYGYRDSVESGAYPERMRDMSANGNDAIIPEYLIGDSLDSDFEAAYSFAVVGDTQSLVNYYPEKLSMIYDWILDNMDEKNIRFVMGLGDITENNTDAEWELARAEILKLQGKLPYSLTVGNHDTANKLTAAFEGTGYREQLAGSFGDGLENTYQRITVGEVKYLIFALDCGASDEVLSWAGEIISANPDHNVIITTHAYLFRDGSTLDESERGSVTEWGYANNGDDMWDKLVSKYENIVLVLSGHITSDEIVTAKRVGVHGNVVTEMLINPQDVDARLFAAGLVATLNFSEDGREVRVEYYSTAQEQYFMSKNQFETSIDTAESESPASAFVPKLNITLDSNLIFNVYVPKLDALKRFTLDGVEYTDLSGIDVREIDGRSYYTVSIPLAAKEAARDIRLVAYLSSGGSTVRGSFTLNIVKYAGKIFDSANASETALMTDVLAYVRSAYSYFKSEGVSGIDALIGEYKKELIPEGSSKSPAITGISSATFRLEAEPVMVFYLEEGFDVSDYFFMQNGSALDATQTDDGAVLIKTYAYAMCETVEIVYGEERASFHINAYYEFAKDSGNAKLIDLVETFWNYCICARAYRNEMIGKK